jgi:SET domain-containing protein
MPIKVAVQPSPIAGQGLFAAQDIKQGTRIIQYSGEKIPRKEGDRRIAAGNLYIFTFNDRWDMDGEPLSNTARYSNHSCDPNCLAEITKRTIWIVAMRDILAGEELTYNYGYSDEEYETNPCTCGAEHCCGYILSPQYWGKIKKKHGK